MPIKDVLSSEKRPVKIWTDQVDEKTKQQLRNIAGHMGPAYIKAVRENLPEATLVFDHFHVIKLYNLMSTEFYHFQAAQMCRIHP